MDSKVTIARDVRALISRLGGVRQAAMALRMPHGTVTAVGSEAATAGSFELARARLEALRAAEEAPTDPGIARPGA